MPPEYRKLELETGDKVRLSELGRRKARVAERHGIVLRPMQSSTTRFWIQWDGLRQPQAMHHSLLEKLDALPDAGSDQASDSEGVFGGKPSPESGQNAC